MQWITVYSFQYIQEHLKKRKWIWLAFLNYMYYTNNSDNDLEKLGNKKSGKTIQIILTT